VRDRRPTKAWRVHFGQSAAPASLYDVALIGKTVTTGASQALAWSFGTAGGEADGPGHPARGETDTGGDGACSIDIPRCCANESAGKPIVAMRSLPSRMLTVNSLNNFSLDGLLCVAIAERIEQTVEARKSVFAAAHHVHKFGLPRCQPVAHFT
jgi:hypothetical protein